LSDDFVGDGEQHRRDFWATSARGLVIDHQFQFGGLHHRHVIGSGTHHKASFGGAPRMAPTAPNKMERCVSLRVLRLQSPWMLCSRATGPHNRICSLTNFRSSSGPPSANVTCCVSLSCLATRGARKDAASSSANLLTIALGVPAGAKTPHQAYASNPG